MAKDGSKYINGPENAPGFAQVNGMPAHLRPKQTPAQDPSAKPAPDSGQTAGGSRQGGRQGSDSPNE